MSEPTEQDRKKIAGPTRAPYTVDAEPGTPTPSRRPWTVAGQSWSNEAEQLRSYYRTQRGFWSRQRTYGMFEPADLIAATARAGACRRVAKELDRLITHGYVIWHDRKIAGTDMIADHVLVGPEGLTLIQTLPKSAASAGPYISAAAGIERQQSQYRVEAARRQLELHLAQGWYVLLFGMVCVDGNSLSVNETPQVVSRRGVVSVVRQRPRSLAPVQVADLAMMLEPVFPATTRPVNR